MISLGNNKMNLINPEDQVVEELRDAGFGVSCIYSGKYKYIIKLQGKEVGYMEDGYLVPIIPDNITVDEFEKIVKCIKVR